MAELTPPLHSLIITHYKLITNMVLTSTPADYSSAYDPNNEFRFDGVDPSVPTEIVFYDGSGAVVGARRYAHRESITTSPQNFLQRMLNPKPYNTSGCKIVLANDRQAILSVGYNDGANRTSNIHFTAAQGRVPNPTAFGGYEQWRTISAGECDEIAFRLPNGCTLSVECRLNGEQKGVVLCSSAITTSGIYVVTIDADQILALSPDVEQFDFVVLMSGGVVGVIHFEVAPAPTEGVRLAWLNDEGYISYHTFRGAPTEQLHTLRSECETPNGTQTLGVESWRESSLRSGYLSTEGVERLSGIATSPRVWRVTKEHSEPQILLSHTISTLGSGARQVELTIRPAGKVFRY